MSDEDVFTYTVRHARRVAIGALGGTVLLVGVALLVLPGPAFLVIPAGLGILALEFAWARRWLEVVKARAGQALGTPGEAGAPLDAPEPGSKPGPQPPPVP